MNAKKFPRTASELIKFNAQNQTTKKLEEEILRQLPDEEWEKYCTMLGRPGTTREEFIRFLEETGLWS